MSAKRWLMAGCGGCLGLVVLLIIIGGIFTWYASDYFTGVGETFEKFNQERRTLEQEYPFAPPEENVLPQAEDQAAPDDVQAPTEEQQVAQADVSRFETFVNVRKQTVQTAEEKIQWLLEWSGYRESEDKLGTFETIRKFIGLPKDIGDVGLSQLELLREQQMPFSEYQHYTRIVAAEIVSWSELPEDNPLREWGTRYLDPLTKLKEEIQKIKENNPNAQIDAERFYKNEFVQTVKSWENPGHPHRELISQHKEDLIFSPVGTLVDVLAMEENIAPRGPSNVPEPPNQPQEVEPQNQ